MQQTVKPIRIGILGAARIAPIAVIEPARPHENVEVTALAARDANRAKAFAAKHGIGRVHENYADLVNDPDIDAIYNPLPNGLHGCWTIAALEAGKHVLCEKPFTANAEEAEAVAAVARRTGLVTMEAFHYRYHALTQRMLDIITSGEIGAVERIEAALCFPLLAKDIRWDWNLAGGALMDAGCYAIHIVRTLAGAEPNVRSARAKLGSPKVDRLMQAELEFADGRTAGITASMLSTRLLAMIARVVGSKGVMDVLNPIAPQYLNNITIRSERGKRTESVEKQPSSYGAQLRAFVAAIRDGAPFPTNVDDAIANMRVIDACYAAAGLPRREPTKPK